MAAANPQFKVNQIAKDLGIKSKEIVDFFSQKGIAIKTQATLEPKEFDLLMESLTKQNQIKDIDAYIDGDTYIPSKIVKEEKPKEEASEVKETDTVAAEPKSEEISEIKKEEPAPEMAKGSEKKPEPEKKEEVKSEEKAPATPAAPARPQGAGAQRPQGDRFSQARPQGDRPAQARPQGEIGRAHV